MRRIDLWPIAKDFIDTLPQKQQRQIAEKIFALRENPHPPKSKQLESFAPLRRLRAGDYRVIYLVTDELLTVVLVDKRNDDTIYRRLRQLFR